MENQKYISKTQNLKQLLITLLLLQCFTAAAAATTSQAPSHSQSIFPSSPRPSPPLPTTITRHHHLRRILFGLLFGSLTGFLFSLIVLFSVRHCLFYANRTPILTGPVVFFPNISPKTLHLAISDETKLTHLTASYYRVELDDGNLVAVKRVEPHCPDCSPARPQGNSARRKVQQGLEMLAMIKDRNLMTLRAYVWDSSDRISLVYDYMPNGSLEDAMKKARSNQERMGWDVRHKIAAGVVKGLRYLHFEHTPRTLHYGLKPSNVLLDDEFGSRLGDCGVVKLLSGGPVVYSSYAAPECVQGCRLSPNEENTKVYLKLMPKYTDKSDIFSFGVILAMLLTGRDPSDPLLGGESGSLAIWLRHLQQTGEARQALDKSILGDECEEDEMLMAVRIAIVCLSDLPADRPSSDELVVMLTQLHSF